MLHSAANQGKQHALPAALACGSRLFGELSAFAPAVRVVVVALKCFLEAIVENIVYIVENTCSSTRCWTAPFDDPEMAKVGKPQYARWIFLLHGSKH